MKFGVVVLICDGTPNSRGEIYPPDCALELPNEVPVAFENSGEIQNLVGKASFIFRPPYLIAEMLILNTRVTSEMLDILYPVPVGTVLDRSGNVIKKAAIRSVGLCIGASADKRIYSVGTQMRAQRS